MTIDKMEYNRKAELCDHAVHFCRAYNSKKMGDIWEHKARQLREMARLSPDSARRWPGDPVPVGKGRRTWRRVKAFMAWYLETIFIFIGLRGGRR